MSEFNNVTIVKAANIYFDGKVTSRTVQFADGSHIFASDLFERHDYTSSVKVGAPVFTIALAVTTFGGGVGVANEPDDRSAEAKEAVFARYVAPILVGACLECHGAAKKGKMG